MKKLNKLNPFTTPEGYFGGFFDRLSERLKEDGAVCSRDGKKQSEESNILSGKIKVLQKDSNGLSEDSIRLPKKEGFTVPDSYFKSLHQNILHRMDAEKSKIIPLHPYRGYYYAVASMAAVALTVFALNWDTFKETAPRNLTSKDISFEDIAITDIEDYFDDDDLGFSTYEMAEVVPVDDLEVEDMLSEGLSEGPILEYLENNTDNFEELDYEYDEQPE